MGASIGGYLNGRTREPYEEACSVVGGSCGHKGKRKGSSAKRAAAAAASASVVTVAHRASLRRIPVELRRERELFLRHGGTSSEKAPGPDVSQP